MTSYSGRVSVRSVRFAGLICVAVVSFFFAIQLLSAALQPLSSVVRPILTGQMAPISYVGTSWLSAYVLLNGSLVAAITLSVYDAYYAFLEGVQNTLLESDRAFAVFIVLLIAVPFVLMVGP
ncbi:hypothetical protein [Natrinema gari]|uniref:hypothetical protein n=1 Tax=Natrinema gari TaxID=419186 RepID=UPI001F4C93A5|nr:hypothetical protein [Natrinema gari]